MGEGFKVVTQDLTNTAGSFHDCANEFSSALDTVSGLRIDSGDEGLDQSVATAVLALTELHTNIVKGLRQTGDKLIEVRDTYEEGDLSARALYDKIMAVDLDLSSDEGK